ncbi:MAG: ISAzo13 family transposase [Acidobacteriales bacterium]|nr:ISAzo13 family transposase [Terriglobales bacterium]
MADRQDARLFGKVLGTLNEAQRRWLVGREAIRLGRGGIQVMVAVSRLSKPTILKGIRELKSKQALGWGEDRIRRRGGGRKPLEEQDPEITGLLEQVMDESTAGDPMSPLKWSSKSTYQIQQYLVSLGHSISEDTVQRRLRKLDYSLQGNIKDKEGASHADRDRQFRYLNETAKRFLREGAPVISVDTKKKERVGNFKNPGRKWRKKGHARRVNLHDFPSLGEGTAIPYGAYDPYRNQGMVNVGMTHDTAEFAVESIRCWWRQLGNRHYRGARRLFICADSGGSNGNRNRAWKYYLQRFSDETGLEIVVGHYPPGTSKWNKIEHRMFSFISMNWKGEPLVSFETVVNMISATKTKRGLRVKAVLDKRKYETGVKISDQQMKELNLQPHQQNPEWNYSILPRSNEQGSSK